jgi:hypothetical protein
LDSLFGQEPIPPPDSFIPPAETAPQPPAPFIDESNNPADIFDKLQAKDKIALDNVIFEGNKNQREEIMPVLI